MNKSYLIKNGNILTGEDNVYLKNTDVLIEDGIITYIGNNIDNNRQNSVVVIDATDMLVAPAFYNLHVHLGETIFRGKCDGMDLWEYLDVSHDTYNDATWKKWEPEIHRLSGYITILENMKHGVGYIVCNRGWDEIKASRIEASCLYPIVNISKLKKYYDNILSLSRIKKEYEPNIGTSIFLQSMYLCDDEKMGMIKQIMDEDDSIQLFVHIAETVREREYIWEKYHCTPIEALHRFGLLLDRTFCVHSIYLTSNDRKLIKKADAKVVLCPISNMKLRDGYPDIESLMNDNINITVATDGLATNNSASILEELKMLALSSGGKISAKRLLDMVTVNPAKYMNQNRNVGIIREKYKTNISIFSAKKYNLCDYNTTVSNMIYNYCDFRCESIISNGDLVYHKGVSTFIDQGDIVEQYCELFEKLEFGITLAVKNA